MSPLKNVENITTRNLQILQVPHFDFLKAFVTKIGHWHIRSQCFDRGICGPQIIIPMIIRCKLSTTNIITFVHDFQNKMEIWPLTSINLTGKS